jgi:pyruvate/2-oxoglutarate/acetoin dehydrogenase E1 component
MSDQSTPKGRTLTFVAAVNEGLRQAMETDDRVIVLGEDVGPYGGVFGATRGLHERFGERRVLDTPISETTFVGAAVGAAMCGFRPVVELMFADFVGFGFNPLVNQAAKAHYMFGGQVTVPLVVRTAIGAGLRAGPQHSQMMYSLFAHVPGLKTVAPATPYEAKGLIMSAIEDGGPVVFCEHKALYADRGDVPEPPYKIQIGSANVVREGTDVTVVAACQMLKRALTAAEALEASGISLEIINPRTIFPLDTSLILESVAKTRHLVVVDEDNAFCGFGSEVVSTVTREAFGALAAGPVLVTPPHTPVPFSPVLEDTYLPGSDAIAQAARHVLESA